MAKKAFGLGRRKAVTTAPDAKPDAEPSTATNGPLAVKQGLSPNPMTNLVITDIAIRIGGAMIRHAVERTMLGSQYTPEKARGIVKGRSMAQTLMGTALARMATRSAPGAMIVGGGLVAKSLYDRAKGRRAAAAEGERAVTRQALRGADRDLDKNGA